MAPAPSTGRQPERAWSMTSTRPAPSSQARATAQAPTPAVSAAQVGPHAPATREPTTTAAMSPKVIHIT